MDNLQFCDDFGHAAPNAKPQPITQASFVAADDLGLCSIDAKRFSQGYIHAYQRRFDLLGQHPIYDLGAKIFNQTVSEGA